MPDDRPDDTAALPGAPGDADGALLLRPAALLDALRPLRAANSIAELRAQATALELRLRDPADPLCAAPADDAAIRMPRDYVIDELAQIAASQTLERAAHYIERFVRGVTEVRTSAINDINLNRWKEYEDIYTDSLWIVERRDSSGVHSAGYWGNFIPQIPYQMLRRYTKKGEWALDPFGGSGTTLLEAQRLGRHSLGVELQDEVAQRARRLIGLEPNPHAVVAEVVVGDSATADLRAALQRHGRHSVQLLLLHPPYFDIIPFSDDPRDLSAAPTVDAFLAMFGRVLDNVLPLLDAERYLALVIGDKYAKGEWIPLGFRTMDEVLKRGCALKSVIVKNFEDTTGKRNQKELWRYRALVGGFYIFKHEYIFVFRKR